MTNLTADSSPVINSLDGNPVHNWFELTYANYYVMPRSILQAMPVEWQRQFVALIEQIGETFDFTDHDLSYEVRMRDPHTGRFTKDPLSNYRYPPRDMIEQMRRAADAEVR